MTWTVTRIGRIYVNEKGRSIVQFISPGLNQRDILKYDFAAHPDLNYDDFVSHFLILILNKLTRRTKCNKEHCGENHS